MPLSPSSRRSRRRHALALVVAGSTVLHALLAWARPTPGYFPDEYIYSELGRSLAEGAGPLVRDEPSHFLPILHPLLTAPAWLLDSVGEGYRAVQAMQAVSMSLAAVAVYGLAQRLRLGERLSLVCAGLTVLLPELLYTTKILSEPIAFPLALAAIGAGVALFDRPSLLRQLAFLALLALAALARLQLAVLPLCYLLSIVVVGVRGRCLRELLREQRLAVGVLAGAAAAAAALGLRGSFGYYPSFTTLDVELGEAVRSAGANALVLAYAAGWILVPGALLGLWLALARPRSRAELAFGALAGSFVAALVLQTALYGETDKVQERYVIYGLPLVLVAFAAFAQRGWPLRGAHLLLTGALAAAASAFPLSGWAAADGAIHSYVLFSLRGLEVVVDDVGSAALAFAAGVTLLSLVVAAVAAWHPRRATGVAVGATTALFLAVTTLAYDLDREGKQTVRAALLPANPSWVDAQGLDDVPLLLAPRTTRNDSHLTLFWNRSVDRVLALPGAELPDVFDAAQVAPDEAGRLALPAGEPLLLDVYGTTVELRAGAEIARAPTKVLLRPEGEPQLLLAMVGRYYDGRLASAGAVRVWPRHRGGRLAGRLELRLHVPAGERAERVRLAGASTFVRPGEAVQLSVPVCARGSWAAPFAADALAIARSRRVGPIASPPRFVRDPRAC